MSFQHGIQFATDGAMCVNPNTPFSTDTTNAPFRVDPSGMVYVDYTNSPAAADVSQSGFRFSATGQLFCTTGAVAAGTIIAGGVARTSTGRVHISFTEPSPSFRCGLGTVDKDGVLYVAGPIETQAAWFRFGLGITSSAGAVSQWNDASGNTRHLKQTTATNQPALQSDGSILFDGVDNYLATDAFTFDQPETICILGRQVTWTNGLTIADGNLTNTAAIFQNIATPRINLSSPTTAADNLNFTVNTYAALVAIFNGASSVLQINNTTAATGNPGASNAGGFTLGGAGIPVSAFSNIQVKEVILYAAALDATQRARVINYFSAIGNLGL